VPKVSPRQAQFGVVLGQLVVKCNKVVVNHNLYQDIARDGLLGKASAERRNKLNRRAPYQRSLGHGIYSATKRTTASGSATYGTRTYML